MPSPERVTAYIDGFNLYFGLKAKGWRRFYWLNLLDLARNLLKPHQGLVQAKYWSATPHRPALARLVSRGRRLDRQYLDLEKRGKGTALVRVGKHYAAREGELIEEIECNKHGEKYHEISIVSAGERVGLWWDGSDTALAYFEQRALAYLNGKRDEFDEDLRQGLKRYQTDPHWQNSDFGPLMVRAIEHLLRAHGAAS